MTLTIGHTDRSRLGFRFRAARAVVSARGREEDSDRPDPYGNDPHSSSQARAAMCEW